MIQPTYFSSKELAEKWTLVAEYKRAELIAYRSNDSGLLRLIDIESGHDILEGGPRGNPFTASIEDAKAKAYELIYGNLPSDLE